MGSLRTWWNRIRDVNSAYPDLVYVSTAIVVAGIGLAAIADPPPGTDYRHPDGLLTAFVVAGASLFIMLRRWPVGAFVALIGLLLWQLSLGYEIEAVAFLNSLVMVFIAASRTTSRYSPVVAVLPLILLVALFIADDIELSDLIILSLIYEVGFVGGLLMKTRMKRIRQIETYAAQLSAEQDALALDAVADERSRIARELHDVVGHTLNLIVVQAGAARRVKEANPSAVDDALKTIENTGRQALGDMDRMLGILRDVEKAPEGKTFVPRPGLARLESMLDEARSAGMHVKLEVTGDSRRLPPSIDLTAYRILQESVTNTIKHAPGATASVKLEYGAKNLNMEISNGPSPRSPKTKTTGGGRGLLGIKERVGLFGGRMDARASGDGGFAIHVSLPIDEGV